MAEPEVTLLLGEQMAIIFLGVNILIPLVLSAVLASVTLVVVQLSRFVKRRMGSSYSKVVTLTPVAWEKIHRPEAEGEEGETGTTGWKKKETSPPVTGRGFVRKRRPSVISETTRTPSPSPQPVPSVSSEGSFASSPRPASNASRIRSIASSNRVSPETPSKGAPRTPTISDAWTERIPNETTNGRNSSRSSSSSSNSNRRMKRKNSDRVISPSECRVDGLADDASVDRDTRGAVFSDDMNVFEIW